MTRCWESVQSEQALDYRRQKGLSVERQQIAVLVQQLVARMGKKRAEGNLIALKRSQEAG